MADDLVNPDPSSADFILANRRGAIGAAIGDLGADPDAAARSMQLSKFTGVPAPVINSDLENFELQHKAKLTASLLNDNDYLRTFITSDPMAAKVANDDYANLDAVSQRVSGMSLPEKILRAPEALSNILFPGDPLHRFTEGGPLGSWIKTEDLTNRPFASAVAAGLATPIELVLRGLSGVQMTAADAAANLTGALGAPGLGRDIGGMIEQAGMTGRQGLMEHPVFKAADQYFGGRMYLENGREPLPTVLPEYDAFRAERNAHDVEQLTDVVKDAQQSLVRERNPDLFRDFIARHTDAEIGISADAIAALYGEKRPLPDDGLLGWVPGIEDKLRLAQAAGDDVSIPLADWVARVDPEVMKVLSDDIRVRPGAITANEMKVRAEQALQEFAQIDLYHGSRHDFDQFSTEKIGEGQGAQTYGHGIYLAQNKKVAEGYRLTGARDNPIQFGKNSLSHPSQVRELLKGEEDRVQYAVQYALREIQDGVPLDQAIAKMKDDYTHYPPEMVDRAVEILKENNPTIQKQGNLYNVKFDAEERELVNYDAPLKAQHPDVLDAIARATIKVTGGDIAEQVRLFKDMDTPAGEWLANAGLKRSENAGLWSTPASASAALREEGIKGLRYKDQGSRGKEGGTSNYVAFDDKDLRITGKNGRPVPLPEEVPTIRAASGLEPLYSIGDRKLIIRKYVGPESTQDPRFVYKIEGLHTFEMLDEKGTTVGTINLSEQKGGKQLYVDMINGVNGLGPRDFGPALMRDVLKQIKEQFPNAETLTGHRVSGAREKAGVEMTAPMPVIKLDNPKGWDTADTWNEWRRVLEGGVWETYSPSTRAYIKPRTERSFEDRKLIDIVTDELDRIVPQKVAIQAADRIEAGKVPGQPRPIEPSGLYIAYSETYPIILYSLEGADPLGSARHEAIHHLRRYGFFDKKEWATLETAANKLGWMDELGIHRRYSAADLNLKLEEAIADKFANWRKGAEVPPEIHTIFEKLKAFFEAIKERVSQLLGKEATWEDIFQKVDTGEIGAREGTKPLDPRAFNELAQVEEPPADPSRVFERANALGMTIDQYKRYEKLIEQRHAEDIEATTKRVADAQRRVQTKQWKDDRKVMRAQVAEDINLRPDIAADNYFADGVLYGNKVERIKFGTDFLTEEQRAALPRDYYNKAGAHPDDLAGLFGFPDGQSLVAHLSQLSEVRKQSGMRPIEFKRRMIDIETDKQMRLKYGVLEDNILDAVKDQVASETQLNLLHEETVALGLRSGQEPAYDKATIQRIVADEFEQSKQTSVSSDRYLTAAGRSGKAVENLLLKQDYEGAFREKQKQFYATLLAKEAVAFEAQAAKFEKLSAKLAKREVKAVEPEYLDFIHGLLGEAGVTIKRSMDEIAASKVYYGHESMKQFVESKNLEGWDLAISDSLRDGPPKLLDQMTVGEMREFMDAVTSLNHVGRKVRSIEVAGEKKEFADFRAEVLRNIQELPARSRFSQSRLNPLHWVYMFDAPLTRMEELAKDLDLRKELGPLHQAVIEPMMRSKAKEFDLMTDLSKHFQEVRGTFDRKWRKSLDDTIDQDVLHDPYTGAAYDMTRQNLIQVMLNWGNRSNIGKFVNGAAMARFGKRLSKEEFPIYEAQIKALIDKHATAEDWKFVRAMWEPFKGWQEQMQDVSRSTSGVAPKLIPITQVETPHGTFEGGYWPVKYDRLGSNLSVIEDRKATTDDGVFGSNYFRAATAKGYLKERTGYVDFVDISTSLEQAAGTMQQTIHDIAFRDSLIQAGRVFYDKGIRAAIRKHYGAEYEAQLVPWLRRIAHQFSTDDSSIAGYNDLMRRVRINLVGHALPLNLKVILSPDVGVPNPRAWASYLANRSENMKLAMEKSDEIRHLVYNMDRDFRESLDRVTLDPTVGDLQKTAVQWGFKPIAKVSQEFRVSTFVDQYYKALERGKTEQEAALIADSYVRERHGAASVVDLPAVMQSNEGMKMLTMFYGYFNTMYNWQRQLPGNIRRGEAKDFMVNGLGSVVVGAAFGAALFNQRKEDDSWFKIIAKALLLQPLSTIPVVNTAASYFAEGYAPRTPIASLLGAAGSIYTDLKHAYKHEPIKKPIEHVSNVIGLSTGLPLAQVGRTTQFVTDVARGKQQVTPFSRDPKKNIMEWARGIITGEAKLKK